MWKVLSFLFVIAKLSGAVVFDINKECNIEGYTICKKLDYSNANEIVMDPDHVYPEVHLISFKDSKFRVIPRNLFTVLPNLQSLILPAGIVKIEKDDFINADKLGNLDLSSNSIEELPENVFEYAPNVETLSLAGNAIRQIDSNAFTGLKILNVLDMQGNKIKSLPMGIFDDLHSLVILGLDQNEIESIDENVFRNSPGIRILSFENNKISEIKHSLLANLPYLTSLVVSKNPIEELHMNSIIVLYVDSAGLKKLVIDGFIQQLRLGDNQVSELNIQNVTFLKYVTLGVTSDVDLSFLKDANMLEGLTLEGGSPNLRGLSAIQEMPKLTTFKIINASITEIPDDIFDHFDNVHTVEISRTPIQTVNVNELRKMKNLRYLTLTGNQIVEFDYKTLFDNSQLSVVTLTGNRFKCSYLAQVLAYMKEKEISSGLVYGQNGAIMEPNEHDFGCIQD